jgi:hypothetical protein
MFLIFIIIIVFQGLSLLACSGFRTYFSESYKSIGQLVGLLGREIGPTQGLYLHASQHNTEKRGDTSMLRVGFEPTIPVFERPKTVRASDRSAIGTGSFLILK